MARRDPVVIAFDLILDRAARSIRARPIDETLLNEPAGQLIELRNAARLCDGAASDPAVRLDLEDEADAPTDACFAKVLGIIARRDFTANLLKIGSALILAGSIAAAPAP